MNSLRSIFVWFCIIVAVSAVDEEKLVDSIIDWVRSKGGFFSKKVEIRRTTSSSSFGVFARKDIEMDDILFEIPRKCYVSVPKIDDDRKEVINEEDDWKEQDAKIIRNWHRNYCQLSKKLRKEMGLGKGSKYGPYIEFLNTQKAGQTPATWSTTGKDLLRKLLPPDHDGVDWIDKYYKNLGCIEEDDKLGELAISLVIQRGYDLVLIPIWDMVNHDNGKINTKHNSIHNSDRLTVRASKDIKMGEEIFATYDLCVDCGDMGSYWGTTEILRDFGFVESYPQRWIFYHYSLYFELNEEDGEIDVWWDIEDDKEGWGLPNEEARRFMEEQLQRLKQVRKEFPQHIRDHSLPGNEWETILQYHKAANFALTKAIESLKDYDSYLKDEL